MATVIGHLWISLQTVPCARFNVILYTLGQDSRTTRYFLDLASEEVACSSGVLLSDNNIKRLSDLTAGERPL